MRMKPILAMLLGAALLPISACSGYDIPEEVPAPAQSDASNPFEEAQDDASLMAMLSHEAANPPLSDSGEREPFPYDGGEFRLDYRFSVSGDLESVGLSLIHI